ncbi:MAG: WXG100 family type VII secretion target [Planctomycetota bacterium]|jgi:uncharacterized protein YukE
MAKAIVDPGELRRFAQELKRFNEDLRTRTGAMHGRLVELSQTWRDQEHGKFVEEFEQTMKVLTRFIESSDRHVPFLVRKAERVEDYLSQR